VIKLLGGAVLSLAMLTAGQNDGCDDLSSQSKAASGVEVKTTTVKPGEDGLTVEQRNIAARLAMDNKPGSIKHLYVISAYSGQVLLYSTVKGKVTSSGKRLAPTTVTYSDKEMGVNGNQVWLDGKRFVTNEMTQDDGTFGTSVEYLYWWDVQGRYHQHYVSGGQIVHISDQPIPVKSIVINIEAEK
jgi:hypothetical protein